MRKKLLKKVMVLLLFLGGSIMYAQTTVTGVVSDATGPLPGVNVFVKGLPLTSPLRKRQPNWMKS